jgi:hypothetical protein
MKRRIFIYFLSALFITLISFAGFGASVAQSQTSTFQHYTDIAGFQAIQKDQLILADSKGKVFLTPNEYSQAEAFNALFIGNPAYKGKGTHVFKLKMTAGVQLKPGTQPNESIFEGTLRFGKHADVVYAGVNPKK